MKKLITCLIACLITLCVGCATLTVDPNSGAVTYRRFGDQHIRGLEVQKDGNKVTVKLKGQDSEATALTSAVETIGSLAGKVK